jgi:tRNA U34 5-carboxymethylaminomethyl modifying enzyme MnmG/GidA
MNNEDKIFVPGDFTDFEKLLFAKREIKDLKAQRRQMRITMGKLQSYIHELEFEKNNLTNEETIKLKQDLAYKKIRQELAEAEKIITQLKRDRDILIRKLYQTTK